MSWVRVDDKAWAHPKFAQLSAGAVKLWLFALCWCNQYETDGAIPGAALKTLGGSKAHAAELVEVGLWDSVERGFEVRGFLEYQPSSAEIRAKREAKAEAGRAGGLSKSEAAAKRAASAETPDAKQDSSKPLADDLAEDLANEKQKPTPKPKPKPIDDSSRRAGEEPCPSGLELTEAEFEQLKLGTGMTREFVVKATPQLRARFLSDNPRPLTQWRRTLVAALSTAWSDPKRRDDLMGLSQPRRATGAFTGQQRPIQPNHTKEPEADFLARFGAKEITA